ncbi:hypothetical protein R3W88_003171 [Solanum pinnatisectum]|uniref:Uncharacterized protein n=1 Tax=Solanum pinnatisectum TaxID=50273 RepID=A0AAV9MR31_9SOLN|nr:hypothetical protein R3W88_003171 [Solanum pinnatisectum]
MGKKKVDSGKRNKSTQNCNHSSTGEDDHDHVSCGRKTIKLEGKNTCFVGGHKPKIGKKMDNGKRKFTCASIIKRPLIQDIFDSNSDDVVIIGDVAIDSSSSGS